jgi:hypothetical protein
VNYSLFSELMCKALAGWKALIGRTGESVYKTRLMAFVIQPVSTKRRFRLNLHYSDLEEGKSWLIGKALRTLQA